MGRKALDCRQLPSVENCSVKISADDEDELLEAGVQHAISVHSYQDGPELRDELRGLMSEES